MYLFIYSYYQRINTLAYAKKKKNERNALLTLIVIDC